MTIWLNDDNQEDNGILDEQAVADLFGYLDDFLEEE